MGADAIALRDEAIIGRDAGGGGVAGVIVAVDFRMGAEALLANPVKPTWHAGRCELIGQVGGLDRAFLHAAGAARRGGLEERALEVRVGRTVEAFLVHIDVDDGLEVIDRAVDIVYKFLLEGADAGSD